MKNCFANKNSIREDSTFIRISKALLHCDPTWGQLINTEPGTLKHLTAYVKNAQLNRKQTRKRKRREHHYTTTKDLRHVLPPLNQLARVSSTS